MIGSVHKAMTVLTVLADGGGEPLPLASIAERVGLPKPTCAHLIKTLEMDGFLVKISPSKGYILGPAAYYLSRFDGYGKHLTKVARPVMRYLHLALGYTVVLAVLEGKDKYILDCFDGSAMFATSARMKKDDIYRTATGRVILSHLSAEQVKAVVDKHGMPQAAVWETATTPSSLSMALEKIKTAPVTKTRTVSEKRVDIGYGAPIFRAGECVAALGIAVRVTDEAEKSFADEEKKVKKLLVSGARLIGERL